jgi:hypothetical protein
MLDPLVRSRAGIILRPSQLDLDMPLSVHPAPDAIREEMATGIPVQGKFHSTKGREAISALDKWLTNNPDASHQDRLVAQTMRDDLQNALNGK